MNNENIVENSKYVIIFNIICIISYFVSYNYKKKAIPDKVNIRPFNEHCKTIILFIIFNTILYYFGNINQVLNNCKLNKLLLSFILICGASIFFSSLSFNKEFQTDLTKYNKWTNYVKLSLISFIFITVCCFLYLINENKTSIYNEFYNKNRIKNLLIITLSYYVITFIIYKSSNNKYVYHPHHWTIFYIMAFFPNNIMDSNLAYIMSMIFIGFYIQGVSVYNYTSILKN